MGLIPNMDWSVPRNCCYSFPVTLSFTHKHTQLFENCRLPFAALSSQTKQYRHLQTTTEISQTLNTLACCTTNHNALHIKSGPGCMWRAKLKAAASLKP